MKVLLADKISETAKKILEDAGLEADLKPGLTEDELVNIIPEYDAMAVRSGCTITKRIIEELEGKEDKHFLFVRPPSKKPFEFD